MSGLDIAAGVIGIASAGMAVAQGLIQIADAIGSAGEEVRILATDTDLFSQMLVNLSEALKTRTAASRSIQNTAEDVLDICGRILNPFKRLITKLGPLLQKYRESEHQLRQLSLRIQWYFRHKSKVTFYQAALGQLKATLLCLLATMNLEESRVNHPRNVIIYQMQVENASAAIEQHIQAGRSSIAQRTPDLLAGGQLLLGGTNHEAIDECPEPEIEEPGADRDEQTSNMDVEGTEEILANDDLDDDSSHDTALTLREDLLSLQNKVTRFARRTLTPVISNDTTAASDRLYATNPSSARSNSSTGEGHRTSKKPAEEPIHFEDFLGRKFDFPFKLCRTWLDISNWVKKTQQGVPSLPPEVAQGQYDLCLPGDFIILWYHWESLVKPGMSLRMRLWQHDRERENQISGLQSSDGLHKPQASSTSPSPSIPAATDTTSLGVPQTSKFQDVEFSGYQGNLIEDSLGEVYEVPFEISRERMRFFRFVVSIYAGKEQFHVDKYWSIRWDSGRYVTLAPFTVYRSDGVRIHPDVWEHLIRPGAKLRIEFEDPKLNQIRKPQPTSDSRKRSFQKLFSFSK